MIPKIDFIELGKLGFPIAAKPMPEDVMQVEECFEDSAQFRDIDLLKEGWSYLVRDIKESYKTEGRTEEKQKTNDLSEIHALFLGGGFEVTEIIIKKDTGNPVKISGETLQAFKEIYLNGVKDSKPYQIIPQELFNKRSFVCQQSFRAYQILKRFVINNDAKIPFVILDVIGELVRVTGIYPKYDQDNIKSFIESGEKLYNSIR